MLGNPAYKVLCLLDHTAMVTVHTEKYGVFDCKPLQVRTAQSSSTAAWPGVRDRV